MIIITEPVKESEILASTEETAQQEQIVKDMAAKAQCCVDHLCGCK